MNFAAATVSGGRVQINEDGLQGTTGQSARHLERPGAPAVEQQLHNQYQHAAVRMASTADIARIWDLFTNCMEAATLLQNDNAFCAS